MKSKQEVLAELEEVYKKLEEVFQDVKDTLALDHCAGLRRVYNCVSKATTLTEDAMENFKATLPLKDFEVGQKVFIPKDVTRIGGRGAHILVAHGNKVGTISQVSLNDEKNVWRYRVETGGSLGFWTDGSEIRSINE